MKKLLLPIALCFLVISQDAFAQTRPVKGRVLDEKGQPVPGASVQVKGTSSGTITDMNGDFSLDVPDEDNTLVIKSVGYEAEEVEAGDGLNALTIHMEAATQVLGETVVTALGITKNRNELTYAAQKVDGDAVSENRSSNLAGSLSGKVSGLEIRQNNTLGGSTNVVIRGIKSITGNNQALFVIDGVPVSNTNMNTTDQITGRGGYDFGNPASDINPDDVESITVLKGAAASALYGSRGANGVIMVTTKKGTKGLNITLNSSLSLSVADKSTFPTYQDKYGAGYGPYYGPDDDPYFYYYDINGDGIDDRVAPFTEDASYGGAFDPDLLVYQWDALDPTSPNYKKARPWVAAKNGPYSFFKKPVSNTQSILLTNAYDQGSFKLGFTRSSQNGILPNSNIIENNFDFGATYKIMESLTAGASVNYYNTKGTGRYGTGYDGDDGKNLMTNFRQWWETNVDLKEMEDAYDRTGKNTTWNWADFTATKPIFWNNPYFTRYQSYESDERDRWIGNINLNYKITDWLNIMGRASLDHYNQLQEERLAVGNTGVPYYSKYLQDFSEWNYDLMGNLDKDLNDVLNLKALLGMNIRKQRTQSTYAKTNGGLGIPGVYSLSNSVSPMEAPDETDLIRQVNGIFAGATLSYKNLLSLDATIRRDVASTLPPGNNTYYYPSVSGSFTFSELMKSQSNWLSYAKLRANYAQVGNDAPIYSLYDNYTILTPIDNRARTSNNTFKNNNDLRPERTNSAEIGLETELFHNRAGFDISYYNMKTVDNILPVIISSATGYYSQYLNSGSVRNQGVELSLHVSPVKTRDFEWILNLNWTRNRNEVLQLFKDANGQESQNLTLANFQGGVSVNATIGQPFGTIRGTDFVYKNGEKVVGADGHYEISKTSNEVIGNMNPDWIGGIRNSLTYKGFGLSFLIDIRKGGDVFSLDQYYGLATGLYPETTEDNDLGNPSRLPVAEGGGIILPGVTEDGQPNTNRIENEYGTYGYVYNPSAAFVYDASYVKLRELILSYSLPSKWLRSTKVIKGIDLSFVGRNLWIIYKNLPYADPEDGVSFGNVQGYQVGSYPSVKTYTFNLKLRF